MAHNLNFNQLTQQHSFVSVKELAWHQLGKVVDKLETSQDVIKQAQLDYEVGLMEVFGKYDDETRIKLNKRGDIVPNAFATYRKDTGDVFGIVGSKYTVVQNEEAFIFFDEIIKSKHATYETAGALGLGQTVFVSAKLDNYIKLQVNGKEDNIDLYMFLTLSHDGSRAITAGLTPVRIVCNNTLNAALKNSTSRVTVRHTKSVSSQLVEASKVLNLIMNLPKETEEIFKKLTKISFSDSYFHSMLYDIMLSDSQKEDFVKGELSTKAINIVKDINKYYFNHPTQKEIIGTGWGAYNAITGYVQNVAKKTNESKLSQIIDGNDLGLKSLNYILNFNEDAIQREIGNLQAIL